MTGNILIDAGIALVKSAIVVLILLTSFAYMTLWERKFVARIQLRYGPNRVGPFGLLQPLADALKLFFKESIVPREADKWLYIIAPGVSVFAALVAFAVIPFGRPIELFGVSISLSVASIGIGILFVLVMSSLGIYGIILGGWASNSKYSLLGGIRSSAQMISYELSLGLSIVGVILITGTMNPTEIVEWQTRVPLALLQPLGFIIYTIAAIAEVNRAPFDLAEAENELVAGYHTEYGGLKFALFFMSEYINMITVSAVGATLFLGGYLGPFWPGPWWLVAKVFLLLTGFLWLRATLPRFRYDRLMRFGWLVLLPLALLNIVLTAIGVSVFG